MRSKSLVCAAAVTAGIAMPIAASAQQSGHQMDATQTAPAAALQTAITDCARVQAQLLRTIDAANLRVEAARQSNSPSAMRAAIDDLQGALGSLRAQLAACRELQTLPAAEPHAGHAMPMPQAPAASPGAPVTQPGSAAPAAAAAATKTPAADPHAGHTMAATPAAKSAAPTTKPAAATTKPADPHAAHKKPAPEKPKPAAPDTSKPPAPERKPVTEPHAGHTTPEKKPTPSAEPRTPDPAKADPRLPVMPVERVADPACSANVTDPKAPTAVYQRKVYYFCSEKDRDEFRKDPAAYLKKRPR